MPTLQEIDARIAKLWHIYTVHDYDGKAQEAAMCLDAIDTLLDLRGTVATCSTTTTTSDEASNTSPTNSTK